MKVTVAYIPKGRVLGLSKIARIADMAAKRLQLQERIGSDIAEIMQLASGSEDVAVFPEYFTLTQLQSLVESVTGKELDKRNFRKSISVNPDIELTGLIDKSSSKRGARLYRYIQNN